MVNRTENIRDSRGRITHALHYWDMELATMQYNTPDQKEMCEKVIKWYKGHPEVYDYVIGRETKDQHNDTDHIHIAVKYKNEISVEDSTVDLRRVQSILDLKNNQIIETNIIGLYRKPIDGKDRTQAWEDTKQYALKGGNYEWLHETYPEGLEDNNQEWLSWQKLVIEEKQDNRKIRIIVDPRGNIGKTFLTQWLVVRHKAESIQIMDNYRDLMRQAYAKPSNWYIIDMPRALTQKLRKNKKENDQDDQEKQKDEYVKIDPRDLNMQRNLFAAIEKLKDGESYDDRYTFRHRIAMKKPKITVFTNVYPEKDLLTWDRWDIMNIKKSDHEMFAKERQRIKERKMAAEAEAEVIQRDGREETEKQPADQYALNLKK